MLNVLRPITSNHNFLNNLLLLYSRYLIMTTFWSGCLNTMTKLSLLSDIWMLEVLNII
jgi:hypothetical protein